VTLLPSLGRATSANIRGQRKKRAEVEWRSCLTRAVRLIFLLPLARDIVDQKRKSITCVFYVAI